MNGAPEFENGTLVPARRYNGFVPACLIAASLIIILVYELTVASQARSNAKQLRDQQTKVVEQSRQIQTGLEKIARDLIEVAKTDDDAKALVSKYAISVASPAPSPAASPAR